MSLMQNHPSRSSRPHHHSYMHIFLPPNPIHESCPSQAHNLVAAHSHSGSFFFFDRIDPILSASPRGRIHLSAAASAPRMLQHLADRDPLLDIAIEHQPNQVDALLAHDPRHPQIVVHDLVNAVKRVLLVDDGVQQDTERPHILLFATVRSACEHFRCRVICCMSV